MPKKISNEKFAEALSKKHPNIIALSNYNGTKNDIIVKCTIHDYIFKTKPNYLLNGRGCKFCGNVSRAERLMKPFENIIADFNRVHKSKYTYPFLRDEYKNNKSDITFICPSHGQQQIKALKHLQGHGCKFCSHQSFKNTKEMFVEKANLIHGGFYNYERTVYVNRATKVLITCPKHGDFYQTPREHLNGCGCPKCRESSLERQVGEILDKNGITYIREFRGHTKYNKSVDFFLNEYNVVIECQGEQHFYPVDYFGGKITFQKQIKRDVLKFNELLNNNDRLFYITKRKFEKHLDVKETDGIYCGITFFIEDLQKDPSILINKFV